MVKIVVDVMLKSEIHDPQGEAIAGACHRLGFGDVVAVRQGKRFEIELNESGETDTGGAVPDGGEPAGTGVQAAGTRTHDTVAARVAQIAAELLANPVIEEFAVHVR